ncbi:MAG: hypothetical protein JNJ69_12530 [Leptospiraceae bacterium]|nr:hypothetical protein [Leptospiraceae bacterium]
MIKTITFLMALTLVGGITAKQDKKKYCTKEVTASIKGQKAECAKQKAQAMKAAGKDKDKKKEANDAMAACVKTAEAGKDSFMQSCMAGEGN